MEILTAPHHDHWLLMTLSLAETQLGRELWSSRWLSLFPLTTTAVCHVTCVRITCGEPYVWLVDEIRV